MLYYKEIKHVAVKLTATCSKRLPVLAALVIAVPLGGCVEYVALEVASLAATDKTIGDHVVSAIADKDCSLVRSGSGLTYCSDENPEAPPARYCYSTLGKVDCYRDRDPYGDGGRQVGHLDAPVSVSR